MATEEIPRLVVFVSYAHADQRWLQRLQVHLKPLDKLCQAVCWSDTKIKAGTKWRAEIQRAVEGASVAVLIVSADFLASDFIIKDELPPLLKSAELEGAVIIPIIASSSVFALTPALSEFQAINDPRLPLDQMEVGKQERVFVDVAERIYEIAQARKPNRAAPSAESATTSTSPETATDRVRTKGEDFLVVDTWNLLLRIGTWLYDAAKTRIVGSGVGSFLLSREEYGDKAFAVSSELSFTNFTYPDPGNRKLGMNAGLLFGWNFDKAKPRYYNVMLTGDEILLERNGFDVPGNKQRYEHLTKAVPFKVEPGKLVRLQVDVTEAIVKITANGKQVIEVERPDGAFGRVGLRAWRSQMECKSFGVESI
jgi:hypothetical protein